MTGEATDRAAREAFEQAVRERAEGRVDAAREAFLRDLDPGFLLPGERITLGSHSFDPADIDSAERATGRRPAHSSGHLDVSTHDGAHHVVFLDLRDPYDRRGHEALRRLLGPGSL